MHLYIPTPWFFWGGGVQIYKLKRSKEVFWILKPKMRNCSLLNVQKCFSSIFNKVSRVPEPPPEKKTSVPGNTSEWNNLLQHTSMGWHCKHLVSSRAEALAELIFGFLAVASVSVWNLQLCKMGPLSPQHGSFSFCRWGDCLQVWGVKVKLSLWSAN